MPINRTEIEKSCLILCEGRDEENFLNVFLANRSKNECWAYVSEIQVMNFGGNEELLGFFQALKVSPNFSKVESILVIRDAEKDANRAVSQIQSALLNANLSIPDSVYQWNQESPR